jgi:ATP-dependent exoDNAse (exonuclease V) beta subunit
MLPSPFTIYKSSAGSGKTYTLTLEYLKLALVHPSAFRQILAVTFTNKATQEMKERILLELARIKRSVDPNQTMDRELLRHLAISPEELMDRATATLSAILHDYAAFSVSTIDSFFQRIIRSFAREIDLQAKFELELDQEAVLDRLVERLILSVSADPFLHRWLVNYSIEQIQEGQMWDVRRNIKELGSQLFQESFKRYRFTIQAFLQQDKNLESIKRQVMDTRQKLVSEGGALKKLAQEIRDRHGLSWQDFKGGSRTFANKFEALGSPGNPFPAVSSSQIGLEDRPDDWYTKTSKLIPQIQAAYNDGLGALWGRIKPLQRSWNTNEAIRKNLDVYGVFRFLLRELEALKEEENILLISDANDFLREITADNEAPFVYEKVGQKYRHYLIDEFQDTSGFQWDSFRPLLIDSLSQGHANLLVGDVKQSIYRWRGGELKLLLEQVEAEVHQFGIQVKNLDTNFRSLPQLVGFNNALFQQLPGQLVGVLEQKFDILDAEILAKAYQDVGQQVSPFKAKSIYQGLARIEFLRSEDSESRFFDQALSKIPEAVVRLQGQGYRPRDIAFLVRTKSEGVAIADQLISYGLANPGSPYSFDVVSDEALLVSRSSTVGCVVSALRHLTAMDEEIHLKTMWYHWAVISGHSVSHALFEDVSGILEVDEMKARFSILKDSLLRLQLLDLIERIIEVLGLQDTGCERAYLEAFKDAVYEFVATKRADLPGFLSWWDLQEKKRTIKIPDDHDAMRILTIHKSKGLQFKVVLMPFLDWRIFDTTKKPIVWTPYQMEGTLGEVVLPLTMKADLRDSGFREVYQEEALMAHLDTLNLVYVAITRAEEVFWAFSPASNLEKSQDGNLASNLERVLRLKSDSGASLSLGDYFNTVEDVFQVGDWPPSTNPTGGAYDVFPVRWESRKWEDLLSVKATAADFSEQNLKLRQKGSFGTLVHGLLEKAQSTGELNLRLEELYFQGFINQEEMEALRTQLGQLLLLPVFSRWFSGGGEVLSERGILLPDGSLKRPDRVILYADRAEVVDFKTGQKREFHAPQVREYVRLVGALTSLPVRGYLCYLDDMEILEIDQ